MRYTVNDSIIFDGSFFLHARIKTVFTFTTGLISLRYHHKESFLCGEQRLVRVEISSSPIFCFFFLTWPKCNNIYHGRSTAWLIEGNIGAWLHQLFFMEILLILLYVYLFLLSIRIVLYKITIADFPSYHCNDAVQLFFFEFDWPYGGTRHWP
jgi:hypothetical protein